MLLDIALPDSMLDQYPLCCLDDRYIKQTRPLRAYFTTPALNKARMQVQVLYHLALSEERVIKELPLLPEDVRETLLGFVRSFGPADVAAEEEWEKGNPAKQKKGVGNDVRASELHLRDLVRAAGHERLIPYIRLGTTSEDDTNLAYGILIHQALHRIVVTEVVKCYELIKQQAEVWTTWEKHMFLDMSHGKLASPKTIGDRYLSFVERLVEDMTLLMRFRMHGKLGGAVGNFFEHRIAYPEVNWERFRERFVGETLGLIPLKHTTQINPHQDLATLSHIVSRLSNVLYDFCQNTWQYISRDVLVQEVRTDVGRSSVMPQKVNPERLETAESAFGFAGNMFDYLARELPRSRMARHLSDSHLQRWLGVAFGEFLLGLKYMQKGFSLVKEVNISHNQAELQAHPEVYSGAVQTMMRRYGYPDAYEQMSALVRDSKAAVTAELLIGFIQQLEKLPEEAKQRLITLIEKGPAVVLS